MAMGSDHHLYVVTAGVCVDEKGAIAPFFVAYLALPLYHQVPHRVAVHDKVPNLRREFEAAISRPYEEENNYWKNIHG